MWMEDDTLKCIQRGAPVDTYIDRIIDEEGNIVEVRSYVEVQRLYYHTIDKGNIVEVRLYAEVQRLY